MAQRETKADLVQLVRAALSIADGLHESGAATYLNQALIALVGEGVSPPTGFNT